jgi:tetrahydromethanopterin S-methyltransferase subunit G
LYALKNIRMDQEMSEAFDQLAEFYQENTKEDQMNLRKLLAQKAIQGDKDFLASISRVEKDIEEMADRMDKVKEKCKFVENLMDEATEGVEEFLENVIKINAQKEAIANKEKQVKDFIAAFQLSAQEELMFERDLKFEGVSKDFFSVMKRIQEIRENCKNVLKDNQHRAM